VGFFCVCRDACLDVACEFAGAVVVPNALDGNRRVPEVKDYKQIQELGEEKHTFARECVLHFAFLCEINRWRHGEMLVHLRLPGLDLQVWIERTVESYSHPSC
jgi:hypothetical protein